MKTVTIATVIIIDGEVQDELLFSMDCSESFAESPETITNDEIIDTIVNDEELNPHYSG